MYALKDESVVVGVVLRPQGDVELVSVVGRGQFCGAEACLRAVCAEVCQAATRGQRQVGRTRNGLTNPQIRLDKRRSS